MRRVKEQADMEGGRPDDLSVAQTVTCTLRFLPVPSVRLVGVRSETWQAASQSPSGLGGRGEQKGQLLKKKDERSLSLAPWWRETTSVLAKQWDSGTSYLLCIYWSHRFTRPPLHQTALALPRTSNNCCCFPDFLCHSYSFMFTRCLS